ncbi:MAG: GAF domain-containing SpoIIE family protein phosphatase, partial [bacterium]
NWKKIILSTPFLIYAGLLCLDAVLFIVGVMPEFIRLTRELLLLTVVLLFLPFRQKITFLNMKRIIPTLRRLFIIAIITFIVFQISNALLTNDAFADTARYKILVLLKSFIASALSSLVLVAMLLIIFGLITNLLFHKSKKSTQRNFRLLGIGMLTCVAAAIWVGPATYQDSMFFAENIYGVTFGILLILMIINSFRAKWIDFLNRKQKWFVFLLSPVVAAAGFAIYSQAQSSYITIYSVAWSALISIFALFLCIYAGICTFLLLLRLPTAGAFDERVKAIKSLQKLSQSISHYMAEDKLIDMITGLSAQVTKSELAWFELDTENGQFSIRSSKNLSKEDIESCKKCLDGGVRDWIIHHKQSILINDISEDLRAQSFADCRKKIGSLLAVPLLVKDDLAGILYTARKEISSYNEFDQDMLESFASKAAISFENSKLIESSLEKERLAQELQIAHEAQLKLLPKTMPSITGLDVDGVSIAAKEVGGDFYGVYKNENALQVVVGDVSGKGTAAAFYMAELKGVVEALNTIYNSPHDILIKANKLLCGSLEKKLFVTLLIAKFDAPKRKLTVSRAGHNPIIWLPADGQPKFLKPNGLGIGLDSGPVFDTMLEELTIDYSPGDFFILYTDGVIEARDVNNHEFDEKKLIEILQNDKFIDAKSLKNHILSNLSKHIGQTSVHDDYTLVVVGVKDLEEMIDVKAQKSEETPVFA